MPRQVTHRVLCPTCSEWAQLRVAEPFGDFQTAPVVVMFSCVNQTSEEHIPPDDEVLLKLIPASEAKYRRKTK
jgi:hypothetical protein